MSPLIHFIRCSFSSPWIESCLNPMGSVISLGWGLSTCYTHIQDLIRGNILSYLAESLIRSWIAYFLNLLGWGPFILISILGWGPSQCYTIFVMALAPTILFFSLIVMVAFLGSCLAWLEDTPLSSKRGKSVVRGQVWLTILYRQISDLTRTLTWTDTSHNIGDQDEPFC